MKLLNSAFPITEWLPKYKAAHLRGDISAGLTVGIMLIPQGMAYALIAGLPPVYGLYASIIPQIAYAILGTSRQLSVAPVAMDSLLVAAGVSAIASEGTEGYIVFTILLAFFMGVFQVLLGLFKLGFITNLLSRPVIRGFTFAAAIIIGLSQLKYLFGIEVIRSANIYNIIKGTVQQLDHIHWITVGIGVGGIAIILLCRKINKAIPGALIAVVFGIGLVYFFKLDSLSVNIVEKIPDGLPEFQFPKVSMDHFITLAPLALTLSAISFIESYSIAKSIESKRRDHKIRPNQELIALGMANFLGSLFQSYPVAGSFSRSAINHEAGGVTPIASVVSAVLVALTLLFLTPVFYYLPLAILASIIMVAVSGLIDFPYISRLYEQSKIEFGLLLATFLSTLTVGMIAGILTGVVLSIMVLLFKSAYPHIAVLGRVKEHHEFKNVERFEDLDIWENILILRVDAPITFINIQYFKEYVETAIENRKGVIDTIILDASPVSHLDVTAALGLKAMLEALNEKEIAFLICDVIGPVRDTLHRTGLVPVIGRQNMFLDLNEAVRFTVTNDKGRYNKYALESKYMDSDS